MYLSSGDKEEIISDLARDLTGKVADRVVEVTNREYHGGATLYDTVNAITRAAQFYQPQQQTHIEQYASRLLAA